MIKSTCVMLIVTRVKIEQSGFFVSNSFFYLFIYLCFHEATENSADAWNFFVATYYLRQKCQNVLKMYSLEEEHGN